MTRAAPLILALACAASAAVAQPTTRRAPRERPPVEREQPAAQHSYADRYGVLEQRNIFLRDRTKPATQRAAAAAATSASTQPALRPEQMLIVRGIVLEDEGFHAYVEDTGTSPARILRVAPGDNLGPGRVLEIQIDAIAYEQAGQGQWIEVGSDLTGQPTGSQTVATTNPTTGPADAAALNIDPNDPNLTTEQRMRLRSTQERRGR
jgi:hypothetical protein